MSAVKLRPDAVITLGEWQVGETGERVEPACVVMRRPGRAQRSEIVRPELPRGVRELALSVLAVWRRARGVGS